MRILVADNDSRARSALQILLQQECEQATFAQCSDLDSLLIQFQAFKPDLLLLDWELPGSAAAALLFALNSPDVLSKVIVLSKHHASRKAALAIGADAFVYKGGPPDDLLAAYRAQSACTQEK